MILIILILALLKIILNKINKYEYNILYCGIWGHCTNDVSKLNIANFKILGLFNESRGKNSCGITYDGEIYHGIDKEKLFTDFIKGRKVQPEKYPIIFGHTRTASVGAVNQFNAHPFGFGTNKKNEGYETIGVHNGTLLNHKELAKEYGIETSEEYKEDNKTYVRNKVDSEIILEIIHKTASHDVLAEYNGRAALVWTDTNKPNTIYLWSGKSRPKETDTLDKAEEERPLNVWIENENSFYFSSILSSLYVIGGELDNTFQIEYNTLYVVTNGNFKKAKKIKIDRTNNYHMETVYYGRGSYYNSWNYYDDEYYGYSNPQVKEKVISLPEAKKEIINIYNDLPEKNQNDYQGNIYTHKLRYWKNGHLINGIYLLIPDFGFYLLAENYKDAVDRVKQLKGKKFVEGEFEIKTITDKEGIVVVPDNGSFTQMYYFVDGIMLRTVKDYIAIKLNEDLFKEDNKFCYKKLSHASMYPIMEVGKSYKLQKEQSILFNGSLYTGKVQGELFEKIYNIEGGNLISTTPIVKDKSDNGSVFNKENMESAKKFIEELESNIEDEEADWTEVEEENMESILDSIMDNYLKEPIVAIQDCREELESYLPDAEAKYRIKILDDLIDYFKLFIK